MGLFLSNRDGGKTDELGHNYALKHTFRGDIVSGFVTTQAGTPALSVEVAEGVALITDGEKKYEVWSDATETLAITTPNVSNPRIDLVVGYVDLDETVQNTDPNNEDIFKLAVVAGTPAGSPSVPNAGQIQSAIGASNPYTILSQIAVGVGVTTITNGNITDVRTMATTSAIASGSIMDFAGTIAPEGWLLCYGQNVSRTTYSELFKAIGTLYGVGDGSTTFAVPDLRGRVIAGQDDMGGSSANRLTNQTNGVEGDTLGATGGAETHTLTTAQIPSHSHTLPQGRDGTLANPGAFIKDGWSNSSGTATAPSVGTGNEGGGGAHNNVQPTIILNKIIKT